MQWDSSRLRADRLQHRVIFPCCNQGHCFYRSNWLRQWAHELRQDDAGKWLQMPGCDNPQDCPSSKLSPPVHAFVSNAVQVSRSQLEERGPCFHRSRGSSSYKTNDLNSDSSSAHPSARAMRCSSPPEHQGLVVALGRGEDNRLQAFHY